MSIQRANLVCSVFFMLLLMTAISSVHAQNFGQVQIETVKAADGVYMLVGSGGNAGAKGSTTAGHLHQGSDISPQRP